MFSTLTLFFEYTDIQSNLCLNITHGKSLNNLVFVHRWSLITGSFRQKMSNWGIKSVIAIDRELLYKGGLKHRFIDQVYSNLSLVSIKCFQFKRFKAASSE